MVQTDPYLKYVFLDFETFYSSEYSLKKMDPPSYILDPRFEAICLGVCEGFDSAPYLVEGPDIPKLLQTIGTDVAIVTHNALFDACILSWRYGYIPKMLVDTLGMVRTLIGHRLASASLKTVGEFFGLTKGDEVVLAKDMGLADMRANPEFFERYKWYCMNDTSICRAIFAHLAPSLPPEEFILHDMILRCAVDPQLMIDRPVLDEHLVFVKAEKERMLRRAMFAGLTGKSELMSNEQFADLLRRMGVDPPMKISKNTLLPAYAFAKTDRQFLALLEHDDPRVVALVEARINHKTTIEETRTERMINIAGLTFPGKGSGFMPIPLMIGAAITHRLGGGWKLNAQNWGRKSPIRKSIVAPPGHKVVAADSSQIEARLNPWFSGQWDLVEQFARGEDVYSNFAEEIFHVPVTKATEPAKRFVGKTGILQLGYQSGAEKFRNTVWLLSYNDLDMPEPIDIPAYEAQGIVDGYRNRYSCITDMWATLKRMIYFMMQPAEGPEKQMSIGPIIFGRNRLIGPNGLVIHYANLRMVAGEFFYDNGGSTYKIYGGKLLENIIQFLARIAVMQTAIRLRKPLMTYNTRLAHTAHDEIVYVVPDAYVAQVKELVRIEMCRTPEWAPGLPLACDIGVGQNYAEAK